MGADDDQIEGIRSRLYAMVSDHPTGPDADQARQLLARLPRAGTSDMQTAPGPRSLTDDQAGVASGPLASRVLTVAGGKPRVGLPGSPQDVTAAPRPHAQTELEADPLLQAGVGQAMMMPALSGAGWLLSGLGNKLLAPGASRLANTVMNVDRDAIVKTGSMAGEKVGAALDKISRLSEAAPERASFLDAEREKILSEATSAAPPEASGTPLHPLHLLAEAAAHGGHPLTAMGIRAAAAAPEFAGRNLARMGKQMVGVGGAVGAPVPLTESPLLQAATGRE